MTGGVRPSASSAKTKPILRMGRFRTSRRWRAPCSEKRSATRWRSQTPRPRSSKSLKLRRAPSTLRRPRLEILLRDARQLFEEGDDRPNFLVRHFGETEARHAGHVDAVLDYPEQILRPAFVDEVLEVGRIGAQTFREFGPIRAGRAVAVDTAALGEGARSRLHCRGIIERHRRGVCCVPSNRG